MTDALIRKADGTSEHGTAEKILSKERGEDDFIWIDVTNPSDSDMETLIMNFSLHPLAVEDCLTRRNNIKIDKYDEHSFIVFSVPIQKIKKTKTKPKFKTRPLFIFFSKNYLITIQHKRVPYIKDIFNQCQTRPGILSKGIDVILHKVLDVAVDTYLHFLRILEHRMETLEDVVLLEPHEKYLQNIFNIKKFINRIRQGALYHISIIDTLIRDYDKVSEDIRLQMKDVRDHLVTFTDSLDRQRESLNTLLNIFLSASSNKLAEIMKVLTVWTVLLMLPTFIVGYYGMNVQFPESSLGKFMILIPISLIVLTTVVLFIILKKRKWM